MFRITVISTLLALAALCEAQPVSPSIPHAAPLNAKIVLVGNSLTASSSSNPSWIGALRPMINDPSVSWENRAVAGAKIAPFMLQDTANVNAAYDSTKAKNILIVWAGTNDIFVSPYTDSTTTYDSLVSLCLYGRQRYKIYVLTMIARWGSVTYDAHRLGFNRALRAGYSAFADVLIDVASLPEFDAQAAALDATYYTDGVHLTPEGYRLISNEVYKSIRANEGPPVPPSYAFKPSNVDSLRLWYYADTIKTLESKSATDTLYRWKSLTGQGDLYQLTSSAKPTLRDSATVWGQTGAAVFFDGSNDALANTAIPTLDTADGITVFSVSRLKNYSTAYPAIWAIRAEGTSLALLWSTDAAYANVSLDWSSGIGISNAKFAQSKSPTTTNVLTAEISGRLWTKVFMRQDSTQLTKASGGNDAAISGYQIGNYNGTPWSGSIMEVIIYGRRLNITEIRQVEEYLRRKYSL